jgi:ribosomal protein S21
MAITIKRKDGENTSSFLYRATKRIQKSGILLQSRRGRFHKNPLTKNKRWVTAMHRLGMERQIKKFLKLGYPLDEAVALARKITKGIIKK